MDRFAAVNLFCRPLRSSGLPKPKKRLTNLPRFHRHCGSFSHPFRRFPVYGHTGAAPAFRLYRTKEKTALRRCSKKSPGPSPLTSAGHAARAGHAAWSARHRSGTAARNSQHSPGTAARTAPRLTSAAAVSLPADVPETGPYREPESWYAGRVGDGSAKREKPGDDRIPPGWYAYAG